MNPIDALLGLLGALPLAAMASPFLRRALLALLLLTPACAAMGTLALEFRMAFFAEAVAHSAFTGVALGLLLGIEPRTSLLVFGVLVGLLLTRLSRDLELENETVTGVLLSSNVALGVAVISRQRGLGPQLTGFLFGDILTVDRADLVAALALLLGIAAFLAVAYNRLLLIALDPDLARVQGIRVELWRFLFAALLAVTIGLCIRAVGVLLATALVVMPAATVRPLAGGVRSYFWGSVLLAIACGLVGLLLSLRCDVASGAMVILCAAAAFLVSWVVGLWRHRQNT